MANVWYDGFDSYAVAANLQTLQYLTPATVPGFSTTGGRFGGGGMVFAGSAGEGLDTSGSFALELWVGFAIKVTSSTNRDGAICTFASGSGIEGLVTYNPVTGVLKVWRGQEATMLGSVAVTFTNGTWYWVDIHYKYHASTGIFEVWQSNNQILSLTSQNTAQNSGQTSLAQIDLGCYTNTINVLGCSYDDLVINDTTGSYNNGRQGDSRIETLEPTSDATPNNGTCSTGTTHYAMVNESPWNSTNYITMTNTSGQKELFGMASLAGSPLAISALRVVNIAENTDAGSGALEGVLVSSGTESDGASVNLGSSWSRQSQLYEFDPHTSAAWTTAAVNAAQTGWKVP